jgi:putative membrane protein
MKRNLKDYLMLSMKGLGMGAADVVPGVSGGTIAFISGIYEELINSIKSLEPKLIQVLFKEGIKPFWRAINGDFLAALFLGIGISIVSLAKAIKFLLAEYPIHLWSFFFGLIIASTWMVGKKVGKWNVQNGIALMLGAALAYYITIATPAVANGNLFYIFICGSIAISAMILPGISGSFILILLGAYSTVLGSISGLIDGLKATDVAIITDNGLIIGVFAIGCLIGLVSFSHVLSFMFKRYHDVTIAVLTGFMIGSLNKVWPWKLTLSTRINSHGEEVPLLQQSILPSNFEGDAFLWQSIVLAVLGFVLIVLLDRFSPEETTE